MDSIAATKLADVLKPKSSGEPVNVHVVQQRREPQPDFDAMKKLIEEKPVTEPKSGTED